MILYILKRIGFSIFVIFGVTVITFTLMFIVPGDPAYAALGEFASKEQVEQYHKEKGLDRPIHEQYITYIQNLLKGDFGTSLYNGRPVKEEITRFFKASLELTTISLIVTLLIGIPLGVLSAVYRNSWIDHISRLISISGVSMPAFWLALLLQLVFGIWLKWLPVSGRITTLESLNHPIEQITGLIVIDSILTKNWNILFDFIKHLILPMTVLTYRGLVVITRMLRGHMIEVLEQDYIRTASSFGFPKIKTVSKYALRNALISVVTVVGLIYGGMLGGVFITELIFSWPGLGRYAATSIMATDYPAIMGTTLVVSLIYIVVNLFVDIIYVFIDPRIRIS